MYEIRAAESTYNVLSVPTIVYNNITSIGQILDGRPGIYNTAGTISIAGLPSYSTVFKLFPGNYIGAYGVPLIAYSQWSEGGGGKGLYIYDNMANPPVFRKILGW